MEAMILAAGLGTRLRPITDSVPKALVPIGDKPILKHVADRLVEAGTDHLVINLHHHAEQIRTYVENREGFGLDVDFSHEVERPLDTGGGLKFAASLFRRDAPFFVHNVDVLSDVNLSEMYEEHLRKEPLATLAVRPSISERYLLVTSDGSYCGYGSKTSGDRVCDWATELDRHPVDFCGIHVLSPEIFDLMTEEGVFSVIYVYHRLSEAGHRIQTFDAGDAWWIDIGSHEALDEARRHFESESDISST